MLILTFYTQLPMLWSGTKLNQHVPRDTKFPTILISGLIHQRSLIWEVPSFVIVVCSNWHSWFIGMFLVLPRKALKISRSLWENVVELNWAWRSVLISGFLCGVLEGFHSGSPLGFQEPKWVCKSNQFSHLYCGCYPNLCASLKFPELKESSSLAEKSDGAQPPSAHTKDAADTHSPSPMRPPEQ